MLKKENLSDKLADIIGQKIIQNELKSGEIIYETQIAKEWGVSRSPVRDTLRILELKRLVEKTPKGSYRVTEMSTAVIQNFYETIDVLFQYAFAKAARTAREKNLKALENGLSKLEKSAQIEDIELYTQGILEFARTILKTAGNPIVETIVMELMPSANRIQWLSLNFMPKNYKKTVGFMRKSYKSIKDKDPQEAAKAFSDFAATHIEAANLCLEKEGM